MIVDAVIWFWKKAKNHAVQMATRRSVVKFTRAPGITTFELAHAPPRDTTHTHDTNLVIPASLCLHTSPFALMFPAEYDAAHQKPTSLAGS